VKEKRQGRRRTLHSIQGFPVPYGVPRFFAVNSLFSPIDLFLEVEAFPGAGAATVESFYRYIEVDRIEGRRDEQVSGGWWSACVP
jgi:hypothetical protein